MLIKKLNFTCDTTKKVKLCKQSLLKVYKSFSPQKCDAIVVVGGDGFMLQTLKMYQKLKKPFYGMNKGSFGFLMNKYKKKNLLNRINKSKKVNISPLEMIARTTAGNKKKALAVNEVSLFRQSRQTAYLQIKQGKKNIIKKLVCDGILVSTPAGSTAYNLSVHGPILSLDSNKLAVTPISPFRPRRRKSILVSNTSFIRIKNLDTKKRPVSAVADNFEVRNIANVGIEMNKKRIFTLLYDKGNSLSKKIKIEQLKKQLIS